MYCFYFIVEVINDGSGSITGLCFQQALEEISLEDRNLQLETLKGDLHTVMEAISQSSAKQKGTDLLVK